MTSKVNGNGSLAKVCFITSGLILYIISSEIIVVKFMFNASGNCP
jgi:hypothetical protein